MKRWQTNHFSIWDDWNHYGFLHRPGICGEVSSHECFFSCQKKGSLDEKHDPSKVQSPHFGECKNVVCPLILRIEASVEGWCWHESSWILNCWLKDGASAFHSSRIDGKGHQEIQQKHIQIAQTIKKPLRCPCMASLDFAPFLAQHTISTITFGLILLASTSTTCVRSTWVCPSFVPLLPPRLRLSCTTPPQPVMNRGPGPVSSAC